MVGLVCRPQVQKALLFLSQPTLLGQIGTWERYTSEGDHNFNGGRGLLLSLLVGPYQTTFLHLTSCGCGALIFLLHTLGLNNVHCAYHTILGSHLDWDLMDC